MYKPVIIEIFENRQLFIDNKEVLKSRTDLTDEQFLIFLLRLRFYDSLTMIDKDKEPVYGLQFFWYDKNDKFHSSNQWSAKCEIHIFSELGIKNIADIFRVIGYKLKYISNNRHFSVSKYQLIPLQRKLKKTFQFKLF